MKIFSRCAFVLLAVALVGSSTGCGRRNRDLDSGLPPINGDDGWGLDGYGFEGDRPALGAEWFGDFQPVYFAFDSSHISTEDQATVEAVARHLRNNSRETVVVEGHTDERGSREYNMGLGERRALAVRAYLIGLGIDSSRIQTRSMGEEQPVAFGHDEESWRLNRRAEFYLAE